MDKSIIRATILLAAGICIGLVIGLKIAPARHSAAKAGHDVAASSLSTTSAKTKSTGHSESEIEHPNILLGDIVTVPFQELYGVLSTLSPQQLTELAVQLKNLPPGKETNAKVAAFFRAWAHLDPVAALQTATGFKNSETKTTAIQSIIAGADAPEEKTLAKKTREGPADVVTRDQRNGFLNALLTKW